jgi:hypothetical protein
MVLDAVWAASGLGPTDGVLCLSDLERRLGRPLRYDDFRPTDGENRKSWGGHDRMLPDVWTRHVDQAAFELWCRVTGASLDDVKDSIKATTGDDEANAHLAIHPNIALPVLEHPALSPPDKLRIICAMQRLGLSALASVHLERAGIKAGTGKADCIE